MKETKYNKVMFRLKIHEHINVHHLKESKGQNANTQPSVNTQKTKSMQTEK